MVEAADPSSSGEEAIGEDSRRDQIGGAPFRDDPVYLHCRREAILILSAWACCFVYTVSFCYLQGYLTHEPTGSATGPAIGQLVGSLESFNRDPDTLALPLGLGIPDWVFFGIVLPWLLCALLTFWFCLLFFIEDDISSGDDADERAAA